MKSSERNMNYLAHDPERYALLELEAAISEGSRDLDAISKYLGDAQEHILEIGCASGNLIAALQKKRFRNVQGIDMSRDLIAHGRDVLKLDALVQSDWHSFLKDTKEQFDVIIALDVLEHVLPEEIQSLLELTATRLKPGGRLILRAPNAECPFVLPTFYGDLTHHTLVTADLLKYLLHQADFQGPIFIWESKPFRPLARYIYSAIHHLIMKPLISVMYFHFYQKMPQAVTRNLYCCAFKETGKP